MGGGKRTTESTLQRNFWTHSTELLVCSVLGFVPQEQRNNSAQEDVNGEKLTVKKWWIFGADFFTVWCRFFHGLRRVFHGL